MKSFLYGQNSTINCFGVHEFLGRLHRTAHRKDRHHIGSRGGSDYRRGTQASTIRVMIYSQVGLVGKHEVIILYYIVTVFHNEF